MDKKDTDKHNKKVDEHKYLEMENNWKRALADYKNLEKRTNEEKAQVADFANSMLLENLLSVIDNFDMLQTHIKDEGLNITIKEFKQILLSMGLSELNIKINDSFDPGVMDAVDTCQGEKDKVVEVIRKGYLFKEKLIRPASVKVGNGN